MTDLETLKAMFARANVKYTEKEETGPELIVEAGYMGFFTVFSFDREGALQSVEAYE